MGNCNLIIPTTVQSDFALLNILANLIKLCITNKECIDHI